MSPRHKQWVRDVAEAVKPHFDEVRLLDYGHWETGDAMIDLESEIKRVADLAKDFGDYVVIAKSIGTAVAALAIARGLIAPKHCVFLGFPLDVTAKLPQAAELTAAFKQLPPIAFVHNENDPVGSAEAVREYLLANTPADYTLTVTPGDTHDYVDFEQIIQLALPARD